MTKLLYNIQTDQLLMLVAMCSEDVMSCGTSEATLLRPPCNNTSVSLMHILFPLGGLGRLQRTL